MVVLELRPEAIAALPATARDAVGAAAVPGAVLATLELRVPVGEKLSLFAYRVASMTTGTEAPAATAAKPKVQAPAGEQVVAGTRDGARREILEAARAVVVRSGGAPFSMPEVIAEMNRRGTRYAVRTIRTMISAHLCAEATGDGVAGYTDITRVGRGLYRLTEPSRS